MAPDMGNPFIIHVYPTHQGEPKHDTFHGGECWCEPQLEEVDNSRVMWVHRRVN